MTSFSGNVGSMLRDVLQPILGDFVTKTSVSMASKKIGKTAETITIEDIPKLADALRPALCTLIGAQAADSVVSKLVELGRS